MLKRNLLIDSSIAHRNYIRSTIKEEVFTFALEFGAKFNLGRVVKLINSPNCSNNGNALGPNYMERQRVRYHNVY